MPKKKSSAKTMQPAVVRAVTVPDLPARDPELPVPQRSAAELAEMIERVWHRLGHTDVRAWVEKKGGGREVVRSNLVAGLPPSAFGIVETVDWEAVAGRLREKAKARDEEWEELVRKNTRKLRRAA